MSEKIEPALPAEEWADVLKYGINDDGDELIVTARNRHAFAAQLLYGQPFGFTEREAMAALHVANRDDPGWKDYEALASVAAKLIALLPPSENLRALVAEYAEQRRTFEERLARVGEGS